MLTRSSQRIFNPMRYTGVYYLHVKFGGIRKYIHREQANGIHIYFIFLDIRE